MASVSRVNWASRGEGFGVALAIPTPFGEWRLVVKPHFGKWQLIISFAQKDYKEIIMHTGCEDTMEDAQDKAVTAFCGITAREAL